MELAAQRFPYLPVSWLLVDKFESWKYAAQVTAPTLLIAAEHDEVIPAASTARLYARFKPGTAALKVLPGTSHNTVFAAPGVPGAVSIDAVTPPGVMRPSRFPGIALQTNTNARASDFPVAPFV
jgi:pimeloyl-ACP methyl ester carboxylesterase